MKKSLLAFLILAVGACARPATTPPSPTSPVSTSPSGVGSESPRAAVDRFLAAVRAQDLQAMALIWGTTKGAARDNMPRDEMEKREILMQCYMKHDSYKVVGESNGEGGRRILEVELTNGSRVRTTTMHTVQGPRDRWYVEQMDLAAVRDFCNDQR